MVMECVQEIKIAALWGGGPDFYVKQKMMSLIKVLGLKLGRYYDKAI